LAFIKMILPHPDDTELAAWLASLTPRRELTLRLALRGLDPTYRADRRFTARLDELFDIMLPTDSELMTLLAEADRWRERIVAQRAASTNLAHLRAILSEEDRF
jgi:hypothetical protein